MTAWYDKLWGPSQRVVTLFIRNFTSSRILCICTRVNVSTTVEQKLWLFCALHRWRRSMQLQLFNLCKLHSLSGPAVTKETSKPASWSIPLLADVLKESYYIFWLKSLFYGQSKGIDQGALQGVVLKTENYFLNLVYSMLLTIICLCTGLSADSYCESKRYDYWS